MEYQYSAGIVVYKQGDDTQREYLLLHYVSGHWDFPKGKIEAGENKHQAALRELEEETGITQIELVPAFEHSFSYYFTLRTDIKAHKTVYFFIGKTEQESVRLSHEHQGFVWLPYEQAIELVTYKNARDLLQDVELFLNN